MKTLRILTLNWLCYLRNLLERVCWLFLCLSDLVSFPSLSLTPSLPLPLSVSFSSMLYLPHDQMQPEALHYIFILARRRAAVTVMTAGTQRISSFAFRSIFHALHPSFSPPYVPQDLLPPICNSTVSATLLYLRRSRGLVWTTQAAAVRANLPTCKDLIHIDLQMNTDQRRLDKACSPNVPLCPASCLTSRRWRRTRVFSRCLSFVSSNMRNLLEEIKNCYCFI